MGRHFGLANQILMPVPCVGILVLVTTGTVMWWKCRPRREIGAPPRSARPVPAGVIAVIVGLGTVFPLAGASMLVVAATDAALGVVRKSRRISLWPSG